MNQYIITEEVAEIIETALESDEHCKKCPYEGGGFNQGALSLLRECPYQQPEQFTSQKKNYHGGECTCNKFVNCHDCRDAFSYKEQDVKELGILRNILALQKESDDEIRKDEREKVICCARCPCKEPDCEDFCKHFQPQDNLMVVIKGGNLIESREALEHHFGRHDTCKSERTNCPFCKEELRQKAGE